LKDAWQRQGEKLLKSLRLLVTLSFQEGMMKVGWSARELAKLLNQPKGLPF
jgi:hypothetical protein